jgi:CubicO group peptidase (beta-lactamase class C family)
MTRFSFIAGAVILMFCALQPCPASSEQSTVIEHPDVRGAIRVFEAWVEASMAYEQWPGLSVGIVHDQELIWSRGFGYADRENRIPTNEKTLYPIASNTKMFTAMAVLQLQEAKLLHLDDPVVKHLDWLEDLDSAELFKRLTIRQLLTHTSGLPREPAGTNHSEFHVPSRQELIEGLARQSPTLPPNLRWKYSNLGVSIAGLIVAEVSELPYESYVESEILVPIGMKRTGFAPLHDEQYRIATGYGKRRPDGTRDVLPVIDLGGASPAGGLWSCIEDLAVFASWQFRIREAEEADVLLGSTLREMQRVHWIDGSWKTGWGLGVYIYHRDEGDLVGHGGLVSGYRTDMTMSPEDKVAFIVLGNVRDMRVYPDQPGSVSDRLISWVLPTLRAALDGGPQPPMAEPSWSQYVGKYQDWASDKQVLIVGGHLVMFDPRRPPAISDMVKLIPVDDDSFRVQTDDGFSAPEELLLFQRDATGTVSGLKHGGHTLRRVEYWQ